MITRVLKLVLVLFMVSSFFIIPAHSAEGDYVIGQGDGLEVSVWGVPEMSRSVTVRPDGKITLPAVGDVVASQKTPVALSEHIAERMKEYVKQPVVTVTVNQIRNNRVYITGGGVSRVYDMVKETSLLRLLSELADFSGADLREGYLSRDGKRIDTDLYSLYYEGDLSQDIKLEAEDILFIPSNRLNVVYVLGAVGQPQNLQHYEGMTVLDAILGAGGFTDFAKENTVTVIDRDQQQKKIDLRQITRNKDISANIELNPGDYVIVDESFF